MLEIIGWIGLIFLILSFGLLNTKYSKYFLIFDLVATLFLLTHAIILQDIPFISVNIFIIIALTIKQVNGGIK